MKTYTEEVTIAFSETHETRSIVSDGELTIKTKNGGTFTDSDTLPAGSYVLYTKGMVLKFIPTPGVKFSIYGDDL